MNVYGIEAVLEEDGKLTLTDLPFHAGDRVKITLAQVDQALTEEDDHSLHGTVLHYDDPTEPVAVEDWEALS